MLLVQSVSTVKFSFDCKAHFLQLSLEWTVLIASVRASVAWLMHFTSSTFWWCILHHLFADDIRVPLHINVVCPVLLQPRRRTPHRSCSNNETVHHSGAVSSTPFPEASDLLHRLRQSHQHHHHPPRPTQWCWGRQGYAKEVVHSLHHFVTLHSCQSLRDPLLWNYYGTTIRAFG